MAGSSVPEDGDETYVSIPHGGPIYVSDMVGPLTDVSGFEESLLCELNDLKEELCWDSIDTSCPDISIDELKILTEEELVDKAFDVAFKDSKFTKSSSQHSDEHSVGKTDDSRIIGTELTCSESSGRETDVVPSYDMSKRSHLGSDDNGETSKDISKKRKRMTNICRNNVTLDESCIAQVEKLARIKEKQEEDKAAARLHSFNGGSGIIACSSMSSEKKDRMSSFKSMSCLTKVRSSNAREHVPVRYPESLLTIEVYHSRRTWVKTQEILVLGRQPLNELKDKIQCLTDEIMETSGQHDHSGYFLIEDTFYNDLREPSSTDYSKPILDWLRDSKEEALEKWECIISGELQQKQKELLGSGNGPKLPHFKSVEMHKILFCDLRFRLGAGYLYCHQGDCKHVIVIRDMRLFHPEDVQNRAVYPIILFQSKLRFQKCSACKIYKAKNVTVDDKWTPENPCYFCDLCYYMLHYVDRSLLYNQFSVYDYLHE